MTNSERARKYFPEIAEILRARAINKEKGSTYFTTGDAHNTNTFSTWTLARMEGVVTIDKPSRGSILIMMRPGIEYFFVSPDLIRDSKGNSDEMTAVHARQIAGIIDLKLTEIPDPRKFKQAPPGEMV